MESLNTFRRFFSTRLNENAAYESKLRAPIDFLAGGIIKDEIILLTLKEE